MASASKTPNLNLPQWVGAEKPERTDFNAAFDAIDGSVGSPLLTEVVVAEDSTSVEITGLDINTHKSYRIEIDTWHNVAGYSMSIMMYINGDETDTNYYNQILSSYGTTTTSVNQNSSIIHSTSREDGRTNFPAVAVINLRLANGKAVATALTTRSNDQHLQMRTMSWVTKTTFSNITSIKFTASSASGIPAGSKFRIYKGN